MSVYLFNFIGATLLIAIINALIHQIVNNYKFKKYGTDRISNYSTGRIVDFKTGKSETQYGPKKSL